IHSGADRQLEPNSAQGRSVAGAGVELHQFWRADPIGGERNQGGLSGTGPGISQSIATDVKLKLDPQTVCLVGGVIGFLALATGIGWWLAARTSNEAAQATIKNLNARIRAWWVMVFVFGLALLTGGIGSVILFGLTSFLALREFITLTPTKLSDHRSLFWAFFIITPLQYYLVAARWYGLFVVLIPVYAFLFIPIRSVIGGDC